MEPGLRALFAVAGRDPIMTATLYGISDADLQASAHYLAHTAP